MKKILLGFIAIGLLTFVGCGTSSSVKIGTQEWMSINLNVGHFRNGDIIPEIKTKEEWYKAGEEGRPAWCYYDNDISNGEKYGKLYNWHAVSDARGLAPEGWHVPTDDEWGVLLDYLTPIHGKKKQGKPLKSTSGWNDYKGKIGNGTDDYGFLGLPGGSRASYDDGFYYIGSSGYWWSSSQLNTVDAWGCVLNHYDDDVNSYDRNKRNGWSVRCLRD